MLPTGSSYMQQNASPELAREDTCPFVFLNMHIIFRGVLLGHLVDIWHPHEFSHLICYGGVSLFVAKYPIRKLSHEIEHPHLLLFCYRLFLYPSFSPCF